MKIKNIYKLLFYILLVPYILLAIYLFWPVKNKESQIITQEAQSTCQKELEASSDVIDEYNGVSMPVDFSDFPEAKTYYTRITETVKKGVNFAGYYSLIPFGVGTDNVGFAIVNLKTGKVIVYNPISTNYHLQNYGSYFVLLPVYTGQTREYYKIVNDKLELVCSEVSTQDMYPNLPEDVQW